MKELLEERWKSGCSGLDLSEIKSFLQRSSIVSLDFNSDEINNLNAETEKYISKGAGLMAEFVDKRNHKSEMKLKVQRIPEVCLRELAELGSLDRIMFVYTRDLGRLAVDNYRPFRSMYFHSIIVYHIGKQHGFEEVAKVCESAVILNNVATPIKPMEGASIATPNLLSFLDLGVARSGNLSEPEHNGNSHERKDSWEVVSRTRMEYAMPIGQLIANVEDPAVLQLLSQHISQCCVIRPVYNYMYQHYMTTRSTNLPVINNDLQFQIYSTTREVMQVFHGPDPYLSYVMYTTLFAIVETNEIIAREVLKAGGSVSDIRPTVYGEGEDGADSDSDEDAPGGAKLSEPLTDKELISLLDWDLAAVIGYVLAHRYHKSDESVTTMRARLGALAFGVDLEKEQPFPPILPLQDTQFHQYIRHYVSAVYGRWPHGFVYMVIDEAVDAYNAIIRNERKEL
ncbi:hypothetical protein LPJ59_000419 [Coemansia sp. RSA 2399]|nr:hypothetical protein LPJ59_000419 [Coemansia sp. RSA 2399]